MAYSPLGGRNAAGPGTGLTDELLKDTRIATVAAMHGKTAAQVILRWHLQRGCTPIPKVSSSYERLVENRDVFDFELSSEEMTKMDALDRGEFAVLDAARMP